MRRLPQSSLERPLRSAGPVLSQRRDGNFKRYPRRDIIPLAIKGSEAGGAPRPPPALTISLRFLLAGWRAKDPEGGGGDPDSEQARTSGPSNGPSICWLLVAWTHAHFV